MALLQFSVLFNNKSHLDYISDKPFTVNINMQTCIKTGFMLQYRKIYFLCSIAGISKDGKLLSKGDYL